MSKNRTLKSFLIYISHCLSRKEVKTINISRICAECNFFFTFDKITSTLGAYSQYTTLNLYNDTFNRDIKILIDTLKIDLIHIHHLKHMYLDIFKVAKERSIPVIYTLHDFYSICPSVKLFNKETFLCNYANTAGVVHA